MGDGIENPDGTVNDDGIQKITVTVIHNDNNDKEVIVLEDYKADYDVS